MITFLDCLSTQHDRRLVAIAVSVCVVAIAVTFRLYAQARANRGPARLLFLVMLALTASIGTWATHFIAMLAFEPLLSTSFDPALTGLSLLAAFAIMGPGFAAAAASASWPGRALGGFVAGCGIASMHYCGMLGFMAPGSLSWDPAFVSASLATGPLLAAAALAVAGDGKGRRAHAGAALMVAAIAGLHFLGMSAATLAFDPAILVPDNGISRLILALLVTAGVMTVLLLALIGLVAEQSARVEAQRRLRDIADATVEGIVICDGDLVTDANASFCALLGVDAAALPGRDFPALFRTTSGQRPDFGVGDVHEASLRTPDGPSIPVTVHTRQTGKGRRIYAVRDLREQRAAEGRIRYLAHHDSLTGLANRVTFSDALAHAVRRISRGAAPVAVLLLDLDRFKWVNDTHGHNAGDRLLQAVSARLADCLRETDVVARLGGDEFAILQHDVPDPSATAALAQRVIAAVSEPFDLAGTHVVVGASVGIALAPTDGNDPDALMHHADTALYKAKADGRSKGRGVHCFFEQGMDARMRDRLTLELDLRTALREGHLALNYQPLVLADTGRIVGFEALLRWHSPTRGTVSPADFIPLAEETGLIVEIGAWVLSRACMEAAAWPVAATVAVNLSPVQFRGSGLIETVERALHESGLAPSRLELEVTESLLLGSTADTLETLNRLKALGISIAMDDFGTGYSSLSYLRSFPFDKIKIDQSFVRDVATSQDSRAIVRAVTGLSTALGMVTTAEGVETAEQLDQLRREGCSLVQGYLFSRPVPGHAVAGLLARDAGYGVAA